MEKNPQPAVLDADGAMAAKGAKLAEHTPGGAAAAPVSRPAKPAEQALDAVPKPRAAKLGLDGLGAANEAADHPAKLEIAAGEPPIAAKPAKPAEMGAAALDEPRPPSKLTAEPDRNGNGRAAAAKLGLDLPPEAAPAKPPSPNAWHAGANPEPATAVLASGPVAGNPDLAWDRPADRLQPKVEVQPGPAIAAGSEPNAAAIIPPLPVVAPPAPPPPAALLPAVPPSVPSGGKSNGLVFAQIEWIGAGADAPARPGTRPAGVADEDIADTVREMFNAIAPRYDFANHLLSLGLDLAWRRATVRRVVRMLPDARTAPRPLPVLDICCGTGDLSFALARRLERRGHIFGADFSRAMLQRARAKAAAARLDPHIRWIETDALRLPWRDASLAAVTTAFGFRNLADYPGALREFHRVLRPGGVLAVLEFFRPRLPVLKQIYGFYFRCLLPVLGRWISGHPEAYRYLPDSVGRFPPPAELARWMRGAGFERVTARRFSLGIVVLHLARKADGG